MRIPYKEVEEWFAIVPIECCECHAKVFLEKVISKHNMRGSSTYCKKCFNKLYFKVR